MSKVPLMNADARQQAEHYYQMAGRSMEADLAALNQHPHGVVLMMPQLVVLMKPVDSQAPNTWQHLDNICSEADAWYIHLMVGDLALARSMAATLHPRRWLCFQRGLRSPRPHRLLWRRVLSQFNNRNSTYGIQQQQSL